MTAIGTISGLIGAVAGIFGLIMGYVAYRRSNELKKSDRRVDLHKITNDTRIAGEDLLELVKLAIRSRRAINNAIGMFHSGAMKKYESQHEADSRQATELFEQVAKRTKEPNYDAKSLRQLEQELVEIHRIKSEIDHLTRRYKESIQQDENQRHQLQKLRGP